jgi:hypothetical protein
MYDYQHHIYEQIHFRSSINPNTFATLRYHSAAHIVVNKQNFTEYNKKMGVIW